MRVAGREIGNQILYDLVDAGGGVYLVTKSTTQPKEETLEEITKNTSTEAIQEKHQRITEYTNLILQKPEANKENYERQEELLHGITSYVQPIIQKNVLDEYHTKHLQQKVDRIMGEQDKRTDQIVAIEPYEEKLLLVTYFGRVYDLESGNHQKHQEERVNNSGIDHVVGAVVFKFSDELSHLGFLGEDGSFYNESCRELIATFSSEKRKLNGPYNEVFMEASGTIEDIYLRTDENEIVSVYTGDLATTPEREYTRANDMFEFRNETYRFYKEGTIAHVKDENKPPYQHTEHFNKYLEELHS